MPDMVWFINKSLKIQFIGLTCSSTAMHWNIYYWRNQVHEIQQMSSRIHIQDMASLQH